MPITIMSELQQLRLRTQSVCRSAIDALARLPGQGIFAGEVRERIRCNHVHLHCCFRGRLDC